MARGRREPVKDMLEILDDIEHYVHRMGGTDDAWHVGVTMDVKRSLTDHGVDGSVPHILAKANSPSQARNIVRFLLYRGMKGDLENYDKEADFLYVYKKSGKTNP
jgi:hypothetical protein